MKVLVDLRKLSKRPSGIGIYSYEFIKAVLALNNDIRFIAVTDVEESIQIKELKNLGLSIISYNKEVNKNFEVIKYSFFTQKIINNVKPDVFWQPNNISPIKIKNPYGKVITTIHDIFPLTSKENYSFLYRTYFKCCLGKTINMSDGIIYVSNFTKKQVNLLYKKTLSMKDFISYNISNNINGRETSLEKDISNKSECIKENDYFFFVGNIEKRKGVDILIEAFNRYRQEGGNKKLYIAGALRDNSIKLMIDESNKKYNAIEYKGYITSDEKEVLLKKCSSFIFPSRAEGFGIPPLEAISFNKPCILSDIEVFREVFGETVNYFHLENDFEGSVENLKDMLFEYKDNTYFQNKGILQKYSSQNLGNKFLKFLNDLVNN